MKNVKLTLTYDQAQVLLTMIMNDTYEMERSGSERKFILQNNRMEERLRKAIMIADGRLKKI